jgi:hypothetical protein
VVFDNATAFQVYNVGTGQPVGAPVSLNESLTNVSAVLMPGDYFYIHQGPILLF